jgi:hypothetical protein
MANRLKKTQTNSLLLKYTFPGERSELGLYGW